MYFQKFPTTYYTLDDRSTVQVVTNILLRNVIEDSVKNNYSIYDEYDVKDGETPEIVADKFYDNPQYHWIVLHMNDIIDPRFDWVLPYNSLVKYCEGKYNDINAVHHYEDGNGYTVPGNLYLSSNVEFANFNHGDVITNNTNTGIGYVTSVINESNVVVTVTSGGFVDGDVMVLYSNSSIRANITGTSAISGTAVTNLSYEEDLNEAKRRIKVLKPVYVDSLVNEFTRNIESINA